MEIDENIELGILIGNLLDNAIEASEKTTEKFIFLAIEKTNNMLTILIKNSIKESVFSSNPLLKTTKTDKKMHGLGLVSVKKIVEEHNGNFNFFEENDLFCIYITMMIYVCYIYISLLLHKSTYYYNSIYFLFYVLYY